MYSPRSTAHWRGNCCRIKRLTTSCFRRFPPNWRSDNGVNEGSDAICFTSILPQCANGQDAPKPGEKNTADVWYQVVGAIQVVERFRPPATFVNERYSDCSFYRFKETSQFSRVRNSTQYIRQGSIRMKLQEMLTHNRLRVRRLERERRSPHPQSFLLIERSLRLGSSLCDTSPAWRTLLHV